MEILQLVIFVIWMFILIALSFLTDYTLARLASPGAHSFTVRFGVIIHELSHAAACVFTGTKIHEIKLFESTGGHVTHDKRNIFISSIISMAPLFGGVLVIILLTIIFGTVGVSFHRGFIELEATGFLQTFAMLLKSAGYTFYYNIQWSVVTIYFIIFLYLVGSISAALAPSKVDLQHAAIGLLVLFGIAVVAIYTKPLSYIPGVMDYFNTPTPALDFIIEWLSKGIAIGLIAVIIFLIPLLIMLAIKR